MTPRSSLLVRPRMNAPALQASSEAIMSRPHCVGKRLDMRYRDAISGRRPGRQAMWEYLRLCRTQDKTPRSSRRVQPFIHRHDGLEDWGAGGASGDAQPLHELAEGQLCMVEGLCEGALHILQQHLKAGAAARQPGPDGQHVDEVAHQVLQLWEVLPAVRHPHNDVVLATPPCQDHLHSHQQCIPDGKHPRFTGIEQAGDYDSEKLSCETPALCRLASEGQ